MSGPMPGPPPGQQPTPEQIQAVQRQIAEAAQKEGLTIQQYVEKLKQQAAVQRDGQQRQQQPGAAQQQMQQQPIAPGPPKPEALAVAKFLKSQDLKVRTCIFQEKRKDMFRVKRAIRVLQSPAYEKARKKNDLLPPVTDRASAENAFKLLPLSLLALRVSKKDPHEGHNHGKQKRVKGLWTVTIEQQQEAQDDLHYMWLYEGSQWKNKLYAAGALILVFAVVMFPLWPLVLRQGVWYVSMGMTGLLGLFFTMAIFRLILFVITMFAFPPGLWLYPNLFEDVGFWDSFKPSWAWHEDPVEIKRRAKAKRAERVAKRSHTNGKANGKAVEAVNAPASTSPPAAEPTPAPTPAPETTAAPVQSQPGTTSAETAPSGNVTQRAPMHASVEEGDDD